MTEVLQYVRNCVRETENHPLRQGDHTLLPRLNVVHDLNPHASYPAPWPTELEAQYALYLQEALSWSGDARQVLCTRGSIDALDILARVFCDPGVDFVADTPPTFPGFRCLAGLSGVACVGYPLRGSNSDRLPIDDLLTSTAKVLYLCNPNNPVGSVLHRDDIARVATSFRGIVIVDEAYAELAGSTFESALCWQASNPNVIVVRTLAKAWGMAGLRLGFVIARQDIVSELRKLQPPFGIAAPIYEQVRKEMTYPSLQRQTATIIDRRERLVRALGALQNVTHILPSSTNFVTIRCRDWKATITHMRARHCLITDCSQQIPDGIKITIGNETDNATTIAALSEVDVC